MLAIDHDPKPVDEIKDFVAHAVVADAADEKALRAVGVAEMDAAVVAIGDLAQSVVVSLLLRRLGISKIFARALSDVHAQVLSEVGASRIINIEAQMGEQIARTLIAPHILDRFVVTESISLMEVRVPRSLVGKKLKDTKLREEYRLNLVALQKRKMDIDEEGKKVIRLFTDPAPDANSLMEDGHILILAGRDDDLDDFLRRS